MGIGIIYFEEGNINKDFNSYYMQAEKYFIDAYKTFNELIVVTDDSILLKLYYNYARLMYNTKNYIVAIYIFNEALNIAAALKSLVSVPELYYYLGLTFVQIKQYSLALDCFEFSLVYLNLLNR